MTAQDLFAARQWERDHPGMFIVVQTQGEHPGMLDGPLVDIRNSREYEFIGEKP